METNAVSGVITSVNFPQTWENNFGPRKTDIILQSEGFLNIVLILTVVHPTVVTEYWQWSCSGTLIRKNLVLTAASCLLRANPFDLEPDPNDIIVYERPYGKKLEALKIFIHPNTFNSDPNIKRLFDFAALMVKESDQLVFPKLPVSVVDIEEVLFSQNKSCVMGGYGVPETVLFRDFQVFSFNKSDVVIRNSCFNEVTNQQICLYFKQVIPCVGDVGSPVICDGVIIAIFSPTSRFKEKGQCLEMHITTFTQVFNVITWIGQIIDTPDTNLEWLNNPLYVLVLCCCIFAVTGSIYFVLVEGLQRIFDPVNSMQTHDPSTNAHPEEGGLDDETDYEKILFKMTNKHLIK